MEKKKRLWSWAQFKLDRDRMVRDRQTSGQPLLFHPLNNQCRMIPLSSFATDIYVKTNKQTEKQTNKQADRERQAKMGKNIVYHFPNKISKKLLRI